MSAKLFVIFWLAPLAFCEEAGSWRPVLAGPPPGFVSRWETQWPPACVDLEAGQSWPRPARVRFRTGGFQTVSLSSERELASLLEKTGFALCEGSKVSGGFDRACNTADMLKDVIEESGKAPERSPALWSAFFDGFQPSAGGLLVAAGGQAAGKRRLLGHPGHPGSLQPDSLAIPDPSGGLGAGEKAHEESYPKIVQAVLQRALRDVQETILPIRLAVLGTGDSDLPTTLPVSALAEKAAVSFWDKVDQMQALKDLDQMDFREAHLRKVAAAAGQAYGALRKCQPAGRLGGRVVPFTQRDLMKGWAKSFQRNYLQMKTLIQPELAGLVAFYRALEFSYGAGLDYDPVNPKASDDRARYEAAILLVLKNLAGELQLDDKASDADGPSGLVRRIVKNKAGMELDDLIAKTRKADVGMSGDPRIPGDFGPSGAVQRPMEAMRDKFLTEVRTGDKIERINSAWRILGHLHEAAQLNLVPLLVGPTGTGKSVGIKWLAAASGVPHLSVAMKPELGRDEMIGSYRPTPKGLAWQWGFLAKAMMRGDWLTLEEVNLAPSEVIEFLNEYLNSGFVRLTQFLDPETLGTALSPEAYAALEGEGFRLTPHPRFRLSLTMNPDHYMGRKPLSKTFANRAVPLWVPDYSSRELELILESRFGLEPVTAIYLVENFYQGFKLELASGHLGKAHKDKYEMNLRGLLRVAGLYGENVALWSGLNGGKAPDGRTDLLLLGRAMWEAFGFMMRGDTDREKLWLLMDAGLGFSKQKIKLEELKPNVTAVRYDRANRQVIFEDGLLPIRMDLKDGGAYVPPGEFDIAPTPATLNNLYWFARRLKNGEDMLLIGETAAGKTTQVQYIHRLLNAALYYVNLSADSVNEELEGGYKPAPGKPGNFRFAPGQLELAGTAYGGMGTSLFVDEFNLNGMVETFNTAQDDRILVTPRGVVRLGPDTVFIGAMNPPGYQGRNMLSPAVRGRYWEIWIEEPDDKEVSLRAGWRLKRQER